MKQSVAKLTLITTCLAVLTACSNLSEVKDNGTTDNPIFPKINQSSFEYNGFQKGVWVNWDSVRQIEKGMNKSQVMNLIGSPHFSEGLYDVREWDYVFNYRENGKQKVCQYKVLFDKEMNVNQQLWLPVNCSRFVEQYKQDVNKTSWQ
ncbi:MAG: outer membrane protein assembly factor BamE [Pasteurella sp.]|nr:outer membrane protein assembly factor BamE [Pasteurella sp.]